MHDTLMNGRKVRIMNMIDDYNREALAIKADYSHSGHSLVKALEELSNQRPLPEEIRCDNGPEFLSHVFVDFCNDKSIKIKYIQPGKPTQNAFIERFNRTFREDILDAYLFESLNHLRLLASDWMDEYNLTHPHQALNNYSPLKYLEINHHI
jgi:putative transposase